MNSVNTQIQSAISDAISNQILSQLRNALRAGSGHVTQKRWNVPAEDYCSEKTKNYIRSEPTRNCLYDNNTNQAYDNRGLQPKQRADTVDCPMFIVF